MSLRLNRGARAKGDIGTGATTAGGHCATLGGRARVGGGGRPFFGITTSVCS